MKDINLLPEKHLQSIEIERLLRLIVAFAAIIFLLTILTVTGLTFANSYIEREISLFEAHFNTPKYTESDRIYKEILRNEERAVKSESVLSGVEETAIGTQEISAVLNRMPKGISAISLTGDNNLRRITFEGTALEQEKIVEYVEVLNSSGLFTSINLSKLAAAEAATSGDSHSLTEFSLTLELGE